MNYTGFIDKIKKLTVTTKHENMCVFVDPKQSHSEIIQNIYIEFVEK